MCVARQAASRPTLQTMLRICFARQVAYIRSKTSCVCALQNQLPICVARQVAYMSHKAEVAYLCCETSCITHCIVFLHAAMCYAT